MRGDADFAIFQKFYDHFMTFREKFCLLKLTPFSAHQLILKITVFIGNQITHLLIPAKSVYKLWHFRTILYEKDTEKRSVMDVKNILLFLKGPLDSKLGSYEYCHVIDHLFENWNL